MKPPTPQASSLPDGFMDFEKESILYDAASVSARLDALAATLTNAYRGKPVTALAILHGSLIFMADLLRRIPLPLRLETLHVSSYHGETESSGTVSFHQKELPDLTGQHVLLLDDILDTGRTLHAIRTRLENDCHTASIKACVLLQKRKERAENVAAEYVGFEIEDEFVVGYGLDYQGHYRNLPFIGILPPSKLHDR